MTKFLIVALFVIFSSVASAQTAPVPASCTIAPGWEMCMGAGSVYDRGCTVSCPEGKRPVCRQASSWSIPNPGSSWPNRCELIPSYCVCKKARS